MIKEYRPKYLQHFMKNQLDRSPIIEIMIIALLYLAGGLLILFGFGLFLLLLTVSDKIMYSLPNTLKWVADTLRLLPFVGFFTYVQWRQLHENGHKFSVIKNHLLRSTAIVWAVGSLASVVFYFASAGFWIMDFSTSYAFDSDSVVESVCVEYSDIDSDYRQSKGGCERYEMLEVPFRDYIEGNIREAARSAAFGGGLLVVFVAGFYTTIHDKKKNLS